MMDDDGDEIIDIEEYVITEEDDVLVLNNEDENCIDEKSLDFDPTVLDTSVIGMLFFIYCHSDYLICA